MGIESDVDMAFVAPAAIAESAHALDLSNAEGVFISCTALHAMEAIDELEKTMSIPVLTSVQCLLWEALKISGYKKSISGFGQLLERLGDDA